jgi:endoglucanase
MPRYGFNFQWMFAQSGSEPAEPDERALDFLAAFGFDFVRIPTDYRVWTPDFDYFHPQERYFAYLDRYLAACRARKMHLSLNMHRVPGYCINNNEQERHNLWLDSIAQDGFTYQWEALARHFLGIPAADLSFDLVNEPPTPGQYGMTRANHAAIIRRVAAAIRAIDPARPISIDGVDGGSLAMPELADLGATHSGRGYAPHAISHYQAIWWPDWRTAPENPVWPGLMFNGKVWNQDTLREFYRSWREVQALGVEIHIGEMGCFNRLPNAVALAWFKDLLGLFREYGWGFAFWNFADSFGIIEHGRPGARYESLHGYQVDRELLEIILASRVQ